MDNKGVSVHLQAPHITTIILHLRQILIQVKAAIFDPRNNTCIYTYTHIHSITAYMLSIVNYQTIIGDGLLKNFPSELF